MSSFSIALQLGSARLRHAPLLIGLTLALVFCLLVALLERQGAPGAADRSLTGATFGVVLPLAVWSIVRRSCRMGPLQTAFAEFARHGADRRVLCLGLAVANALWCAGLGTILGAATVLTARGLADALVARDIWASVSVGGLAGAAYACWFTGTSSFGKRGGGRTAFLVLDWVLGSSATSFALVVPRGHILNLLGAGVPLQLSQPTSAVCLAASIFFLLALAIYRIPR